MQFHDLRLQIGHSQLQSDILILQLIQPHSLVLVALLILGVLLQRLLTQLGTQALQLRQVLELILFGSRQSLLNLQSLLLLIQQLLSQLEGAPLLIIRSSGIPVLSSLASQHFIEHLSCLLR